MKEYDKMRGESDPVPDNETTRKLRTLKQKNNRINELKDIKQELLKQKY